MLNFLLFSLSLAILVATLAGFIWTMRFLIDTVYDFQQFRRSQNGIVQDDRKIASAD